MQPSLIKRIAAEGIQYTRYPEDEQWNDAIRKFIGKMSDAPIIEITGAAKMAGAHIEENALKRWGNLLDKYGTLTPPFERMWLECLVPVNEQRPDLPKLNLGYAVDSIDREQVGAKRFAQHAACFHGLKLEDSHRWLVVVWLFYVLGGQPIIAPKMMTSMLLHADGRPDWSNRLCHYRPSVVGAEFESVDRLVQAGLGNTTLAPLYEALDILHCQNVGLRDEPVDLTPRGEKRWAGRFGERHGGYRYHTIVVRPAGAKTGGGQRWVKKSAACRFIKFAGITKPMGRIDRCSANSPGVSSSRRTLVETRRMVSSSKAIGSPIRNRYCNRHEADRHDARGDCAMEQIHSLETAV